MRVPAQMNEDKTTAELAILLPSLKINPKHVKKNGKLFEEEVIKDIRQYHDKHPELLKLSRKAEDPKVEFSVAFFEDEEGPTKPKKMIALYRDRSVDKDTSLLGKGGGGTEVRFGQDLDTGEWLAVKVMIADEKDAKLEKEYQMLKYLGFSHGHIYRNGKQYFMQVYFKGQSLAHLVKNEDFIEKSKHDPEHAMKELLYFFIQAWDRVEELHEKGIAHRDLHGNNIMVDRDSRQVVLFDFGLSKKLKHKFAEEVRSEELSLFEGAKNRIKALLKENKTISKKITDLENLLGKLEAKKSSSTTCMFDETDQKMYEEFSQEKENQTAISSENASEIANRTRYLNDTDYKQTPDDELIQEDLKKFIWTFRKIISGESTSKYDPPINPALNHYYKSDQMKTLRASLEKMFGTVTETDLKALKETLIATYQSMCSDAGKRMEPK